ncbi:MAG: hypothetical protein Kow00122_17720 [Thermoleophilia bacterium]
MTSATETEERGVETMAEPLCVVRGLVFREGTYWASLVLNFDIATVGDTPEQAMRAAIELSADRIREGLREGKSWDEIQRPAPLRYWLRFWWETTKHTIRRRLRDGYQTFEAPIPLGC